MRTFDKKKRRPSELGQLIIPVILASMLLGGLMVLYQVSFGSMMKKTGGHVQRLVAAMAVSELLEFFRGQTQANLLSYLAKNPISGNASDAYFYCAHINLLNRENGKVLNRDDLASMPRSWLDNAEMISVAGTSVFGDVNRYYQVFLIDPITMQIDGSACTQRMGTIHANRKLLISVGVSWIPKNHKGTSLSNAVQGSSATVIIPS